MEVIINIQNQRVPKPFNAHLQTDTAAVCTRKCSGCHVTEVAMFTSIEHERGSAGHEFAIHRRNVRPVKERAPGANEYHRELLQQEQSSSGHKYKLTASA